MTTTPSDHPVGSCGGKYLGGVSCNCAKTSNGAGDAPKNINLGLSDPIADKATSALAYWDVAVQHGDEGPEEFAGLLEAAEQIRDAGGPRAEEARQAVDQFDQALAKAEDVDKDISVDDEQVVIDVVRGYMNDREDTGVEIEPVAPPVADDLEINGDDRLAIRDHIGMMNVFAISGGKITPLKDGIELPIGRGYRVRVRKTRRNGYSVERMFVRGGKEWSYGKHENVSEKHVGNMAYWASCYNNDSGTEWTFMGR